MWCGKEESSGVKKVILLSIFLSSEKQQQRDSVRRYIRSGKNLFLVMKRACSPNSLTSLNYSSVTIECLERPDVLDDTESFISGSVLRDGKLAWLVRGATLEVINTSTGSRQASYRFGWTPNQQRSVRISSVSELYIEDGTKLLVGLKDLSGGGGGIVCIFDPFLSRVIKAIEVPYPVTVVEGVTGSGGASASPHAFRFALLRYMS